MEFEEVLVMGFVYAHLLSVPALMWLHYKSDKRRTK